MEVVFLLREEVELWLCALSLKCEVDICLAKCHPSSVEVIEFVGIPLVRGGYCVGLCLASSERLYWLREELCTPKLYLPKSSVEVPCVRSLVWTS